MRLYFMLRHAGYPEEKCQSAYFNCGKSYGFFLLNKNIQYPVIFKAIFGFIWIWILCHGLCIFLHMREVTWAFRMYRQQHRKRQDMTHVTLKLMKVSLPAQEACTTISMNKKKKSSHSLWLLPLNFTRQLWKIWFQPCFKGVFHKRTASLIKFVFYILFRQEQKILARKGRLLACDQKRKSLIGCDFGIQEYWDVIRKNLLRKRHLQRKNRLHFTL